MKKRTIVISLGGSLIIPKPGKIDTKFLKQFKSVIKNNSKKYKFIIVCGGGTTSRTYIKGLKDSGANYKLQSLSGISITRHHARFMNYFFGNEVVDEIPLNMKQLKEQIKKRDLVFCGSLGYNTKQTTDGTSADIASEIKTEFINLTNVGGLHDKNPKKFKNAKFISKISWKKFNSMANKLSFKPGQHFVLDQSASKTIMKNRITTCILGKDLKQLNKLLKGKKFKGTTIGG